MNRTPSSTLSSRGVSPTRTASGRRIVSTSTPEAASNVAAVAYTAHGWIANRSPPTAGPETVAIWNATERRAIAAARRSDGTISGARERAAGAPNAPATPVSAARATNAHS